MSLISVDVGASTQPEALRRVCLALARVLDVKLLTCDRRPARAPEPRAGSTSSRPRLDRLTAVQLSMMEDIFSAIYRDNVWGSQESRSGPGSTLSRAAEFLPDLVALLRTLNTRVLIDAPCGDFNWAGLLADAVERYIGVDVVGEIIARNQRLASGPTRIFLHGDLTKAPLPSADVILCRDCLVHFAFRDIWRALRNFQESGGRYLLTTTFIERDENPDIATGGWRPLNLERPPFCFPPPVAVVDERCLHSGGSGRDKRLALWELASLPTSPQGGLR